MTSIRDRGIKRTFAPMQERLDQGQQLQSADVQALIESAQDGPGVTKTERTDLERILAEHGSAMDPAAKDALTNFVVSQGGSPAAGTLSPLNLQIQNASIRKALTGEDGGPAILADDNVTLDEAQRLLDIVEGNGVISNRERRDLRAILLNRGVTFNPSARLLLEQAANILVEPPAHMQVSGADIQSAHVDPNKNYRQRSFAMGTLESMGLDPAVLGLFQRADALGSGNNPANNGYVTTEELVALEQQGALLPAEQAALPGVWRLMEASELSPPDVLDTLPVLEAEDLSVRPSPMDVSETLIDVSALDPSMHALAQRAVLIADGNGADLTKVSIAKVQFAIDNNHQASTPHDRQQMESHLLTTLQPLAVAASAPELKAAGRIPDLGEHRQTLVNRGGFKIGLNTKTELSGRVFERSGSWSPVVQRHGYNTTAHYPDDIPKFWDIDLDLTRKSTLEVEVPAGHQLFLIAKDQLSGRDRQLEAGANPIGGRDELVPGDYRAVLMKDGEIVDEAALRLGGAAPEQSDISDLYGFDLETASGQSVGLHAPNNMTNSSEGWTQTLEVTLGGMNNLPSQQAPVSLEPGRYEGEVTTGYATDKPFVLDVLPGSNLEVTVDGVKTRLFPVDEAPSTKYVGHLDQEGLEQLVIQFNPMSNKLFVVEEKFDTWHGSTAWHGEVERRERAATTIYPFMRTG